MCPRVQPGKIIALRSQPVQSRNPVSGSLVCVAEGDSYYQLDHTHVFYFGLDENHDAEESRKDGTTDVHGPYRVANLRIKCH